MKRFVVLFGLLGCMNFTVFAQEGAEEEQMVTITKWYSLGYSWGNFLNFGPDIDNFYLGSPGINFNGYSFAQKNVGLFFNYGLMFPNLLVQDDSVTAGVAFFYRLIIQYDYITGVAFRHKIKDAINLYFGIGPHSNIFHLLSVNTNDVRFGLGIGGAAELKADVTDSIFIDFGITWSYDFATYRIVESTNDNWKHTKAESNGWINNSAFGIKSYIALGLNLFKKVKIGKPKTE